MIFLFFNNLCQILYCFFYLIYYYKYKKIDHHEEYVSFVRLIYIYVIITYYITYINIS